jgi:ABC-type cobalamin transport system permease subunit
VTNGIDDKGIKEKGIGVKHWLWRFVVVVAVGWTVRS